MMYFYQADAIFLKNIPNKTIAPIVSPAFNNSLDFFQKIFVVLLFSNIVILVKIHI